jgi:hypothetical protein
MDTDGSSTEDFRSVIDDLTIANKKLKQKLRKYEKLYDNHLQDEKLFEVRFHGLPDHKKRELEETLRKFASDLDGSVSNDVPNVPQLALLETHRTASSTSRFTESGYASMSGLNSYAPSGQDSDRRVMSKAQYKSQQQQNIQSYLHDIPAGLLPKQNIPMTEKSRKKLVVRRLEQIFAGKRPVPGNHPQPMQQEEVAQSAAMADRRAKEAIGQLARKEGFREARIMSVRAEDEDMAIAPQDPLLKLRPTIAVNEGDSTGNVSPDQRPTRPLDLDLYRAQVPAENMDYIRHLGFTPPSMQSDESPEEGHGWIYLNLLINMAQLHTINVTPDFIKEALSDYSSKFELSHDGRKVRWKGGYDLTRNSDSSSEHLSGLSPNPTSGGSSSRLKTGHSGDSSESIGLEKQDRHVSRVSKEKTRNKFAYTPIFFHKQESEEDDESYNYDVVSSSNSPFMAQQKGDSSGFGSSAIRSSALRSSTSRKRREDGPMIFYNRAKFCTDLTGDRRGSSIANPASSYKSFSTQPLGEVSKSVTSDDDITGIGEPRGPFGSAPMDLDSKDSDRIATSSGEDIEFSPPDLRNDSSEESASTMEFEASGLGGVQPEDNFAIRIRRSQVRIEPSSDPRGKAKKPQLYPKKILAALNEDVSPEEQAQPTFSLDITSMSRRNMPSSALPPASFLPFDSTSSGDVDSDLESDVSSSPSSSSSSDHEHDPAAAFELLNISPMHPSVHPVEVLPLSVPKPSHAMDIEHPDPDATNSGDSDGSDDSNASVDMLATVRKLYPKTVRASEREYDAEIADRIAEEIPAGSSAATAGGGSGYNSPMSVVVEVPDGEDSKGQSSGSGTSSQKAKRLKRARTSESIAKFLQQPEKSQKLK